MAVSQDGITSYTGISIGTQGTAIPMISSFSSSVGVWVVQGSASSFTVVTWPAVRKGDVILTSPNGGAGASSISSGLIPWSHCTQDGQVELRLSNVSTLALNQTAQVFNFVAIRPR
jgi:hypothetical protein